MSKGWRDHGGTCVEGKELIVEGRVDVASCVNLGDLKVVYGNKYGVALLSR